MSKDAECRTFTEIFNHENQAIRHSKLKIALDYLNARWDTIGCQINEVHEQNQRQAELNEQRGALQKPNHK